MIGRSIAIWWRHQPAFASAALVFDAPVLAIEAVAGPIEPGHPSFQFQMSSPPSYGRASNRR